RGGVYFRRIDLLLLAATSSRAGGKKAEPLLLCPSTKASYIAGTSRPNESGRRNKQSIPMGKTLVRDETIPEAPSVDPAEIDKFRAMAADWWSPTGKFAPLHKFNPVRLTFIRDAAVSHFGLDGASRRPLEGLRLLDAGCGGGLVTEPMARLGAHAV